MPKHPKLPRFIPPMLAMPGQAFDSPDYLYEIKWDGTRTLAFIEHGCYRLVNRRRVDMTDRYPEMAFLSRLPPGTILDGEVVVLQQGKPDFGKLQAREQARTPLKIRSLSRTLPATYIVFDLLYESFHSVMGLTLELRRERLRRMLHRIEQPPLLLSEGLIGAGIRFFENVVQQSLEGMVAKRLRSRYLPGKRSSAWIKVKRGSALVCAVIGFLPAGADDFRSLIVATHEHGALRCIGKVGGGFTRSTCQSINQWLWCHLQAQPAAHTRIPGKWVAPGLYCKVRFLERTAHGELRAPVFEELIPAPGEE